MVETVESCLNVGLVSLILFLSSSDDRKTFFFQWSLEYLVRVTVSGSIKRIFLFSKKVYLYPFCNVVTQLE